MALTQDECDEVYSGVADVMRDRGLGWIVDEVQTTIALGKIRTIRINRKKKLPMEVDLLRSQLFEPQSLFPGTPHPGTAQSSSDESGSDELTSENYSPQEKLKLLLESLARYIQDYHDLAIHLPDVAVRTETAHDIYSVTLVSDDGVEIATISPTMDTPDIGFASRIQSIIDGI